MPFFNVVGGVTIREREQRKAGEPRYRRLEFVKSKSDTDYDSWPIISSSEPVRGIQLYQPRQQYNYYPHHGFYSPQQAQHIAAAQHHARMQQMHQLHHRAQFPSGHPIHDVPAPALSTGQRPHRQIENRPADVEFVEIIDPSHKKHDKKDKKAKKIDPGYEIYESTDESDSDAHYVPIKPKKRQGRSYHR